MFLTHVFWRLVIHQKGRDSPDLQMHLLVFLGSIFLFAMLLLYFFSHGRPVLYVSLYGTLQSSDFHVSIQAVTAHCLCFLEILAFSGFSRCVNQNSETCTCCANCSVAVKSRKEQFSGILQPPCTLCSTLRLKGIQGHVTPLLKWLTYKMKTDC